ncbi:MAG: hypothetical protein HY096_13955 [Nitrospinae bacterium]|nr:hypothetical protein [Nitrospinota bacterium]
MKTDKRLIMILMFLTIFVVSFNYSALSAEKKIEKKTKVKETTPKPVEQSTPSAEKPAETMPPVSGAEESSGKTLDPKDPRSLIYLDTKGNKAGTGDVTKSGVASTFAKVGAGFHPAALAETNLPMDKYKLVDWAKIVKEKIIAPQYSLDMNAKPEDEQMIDLNILFETKSDFMDNVIFPHNIHTWWLKCEICHETVGGPIFEPSAGANDVKMVEMAGGKWCGRCHNKIAFPLADCKRCHISAKGVKPDESVTLRTISKSK